MPFITSSMKNSIISLVVWTCLTATLGAGAQAQTSSPPPRTFALSGERLLAQRIYFASPVGQNNPELAKLLLEAGQALQLREASVMDKTRLAASGDKHDYVSLGPYWWPDPEKPNGLPYIRKDGNVNPESRSGTDERAMKATCRAVETLGLAFWFTGQERYAIKAAALLRTWFLHPATRMNPNLQYAQAIPGITSGRGIGIIDTHNFIALQDSLALLAGSGAWTQSDQTAMQEWLKNYYQWLRSSANGLDEASELNNHGTWYDALTVALALGTGHIDDARSILQALPTKRLAVQLDLQGRQPLELARTNSLNYSIFNLTAYLYLAQLGQAAGVDVWKLSTTDGKTIASALHAIAPYADPNKPWPQVDLQNGDRAKLVALLVQALQLREDPLLRATVNAHPEAPTLLLRMP